MSGLEELRKKLAPLFDAEKGFSAGSTLDPCDSYTLSDGGTVNLLSRSYGMYNINELGLQKCTSSPVDETDGSEKTYKCASHEMRIFGAIGSGASSVVQRAIHIPNHRILALKKINIFEKEKRQQLLTEIRTLCEAPCYQGLVEFHGAFYVPDSGQISIALEYMDGGSLADILRLQKRIPEPVLSSMFQKLLHGLSYLHGVRHLVHRDIKPANLLVNLKGEPKITDFGISAGLENSMAMCATFVGTVTYMSPERIRNESYSYPADIWSLGLALFECGTGEFPYSANEGPVNLMLQILDDPSPMMLLLVNGDDEVSVEPVVKIVKGKKVCQKGWECKRFSKFCCNETISDYFQTYQFENLFAKRNTPVAHAVGFWDYHSFITAAAEHQPDGFGTTGGKKMAMKEVAAFLGHVGSKTSCGYGVATGGPLAWGLCYNKELSPDSLYCDEYYKLTYPCAPGAAYYGRGALPLYWNYNYGKAGEALKVDLLNHPEYIEQNATLAFQAAVWRWMTPVKKNQPSAHDAFVGNWKPTKNDTLAKRVPGFGITMNILYGDSVCGQGDSDSMNNIVSHYQYYLDLMGVGREEAGPHEVLTCSEQLAFNPSSSSSTS